MTRVRALQAGLVLVAVLALVGGGYLWLRGSSLVRVRDVQITGVSASDGDRVIAALTSAAHNMTTLDVDRQALRDATVPYSSVAAVEADADFPHTLKIRVIERRPVAALAEAGARRVPVTGSGLLMNGVTADRALPSLVLEHRPAGTRITDRKILDALTVAGAAPAPLLSRSSQLDVDDRGVVVVMDDGPDLVFGNDSDARAKWSAAARVLAESSSAGATYLDLRIPGRVAAGGLAPVASPTADPNLQPEAENSLTLDP
jgi:cell division protein FtsQ